MAHIGVTPTRQNVPRRLSLGSGVYIIINAVSLEAADGGPTPSLWRAPLPGTALEYYDLHARTTLPGSVHANSRRC